MLWVLKGTLSMRRSFEHPRHAKHYGQENIYNFTQKIFVSLNLCWDTFILCFQTYFFFYIFHYSISKKCSNSSSSHGNRSASADSSYRTAWAPQMDASGTGVLPSQPFVQDPSMPPLPLPNTTVQLEEVHRRLEADHTKVAPVKSK